MRIVNDIDLEKMKCDLKKMSRNDEIPKYLAKDRTDTLDQINHIRNFRDLFDVLGRICQIRYIPNLKNLQDNVSILLDFSERTNLSNVTLETNESCGYVNVIYQKRGSCVIQSVLHIDKVDSDQITEPELVIPAWENPYMRMPLDHKRIKE